MAGENSGLTSGLHAPSEGVVKLLALLCPQRMLPMRILALSFLRPPGLRVGLMTTSSAIPHRAHPHSSLSHTSLSVLLYPQPHPLHLLRAVPDNQLPSPAETCYRLNLIYTPTWKPALQLLKIFKLMNWIKMFSPLKYLNYMKFFGDVMDSPVTGFTLLLWSMGDCTTKYCKASTKAIKRLHAGYMDAINAGFSLGLFRNSVHHEDILEF